MYLDADEVLVAEDAEQAARADRAHLARGLLPRRDELHRRPRATAPRSRTTRCGSSATAPSTASRGACTSRSARRLPGYLPERIEQTDGPRRALRLPRRRARREGEVAAQHRAAARAAGREPADARSCTSTSAPSTRRPATRRRRCASSSAPGRWSSATDVGGAYEFTPSLIVAARQVAAGLRPRRRTRSSAPRDGLARFPGFTDLVFEQATACARARRREAEAIALLRALHRARRRARRATPRPSAAAPTCRGSRSPSCTCSAARSRRRASCSTGA